eukprot:TRINITY_DN8255_c0_g1_i2.p1 TRINITY_DN8255_c0_g1~~TRINITY_DN8255_c0_g1_i2.p1  ORF type:complete len:1085 (-),score=304.99 TRINITY_DN8255_c0_g1_i2:578-3832(-)
MAEDTLAKAHKLLGILVTPTAVQPGEPRTWFSSLLAQKTADYTQAVDGSLIIGGEPVFDYVRCCVHALVNLKLELVNALEAQKKQDSSVKGPKLEADALSIAQQKNVSSILEIMIVLGVLPNLIPGVGVPIHKRSEFLQIIFKDLPKLSMLEQYKQLVFTLDALLDLATHRNLSALVLTKHMSDILASLVQISHAPLMKPVEKEKEEATSTEEKSDLKMDSSEDKFVMTEDLYARLTADQQRYRKELDRMLVKCYQPTVVRNLIVLHGSSKGTKNSGVGGKKAAKPAPKWFSKKISELLTARLMAENGVANVIRGVLDMAGGDIEGNMDWQKVGLVATVLGNPPEGNYASIENYYQNICPQIIHILNTQDDKVYQMIACASIKTVTERSLILSRRYLLEVIMDPFLKLAAGCDSKSALEVTEQQLDDCLKSLFKIFVIGTDPCVVFLSNLEKIILMLLEVHSAIALGASHLRDPVKQMITRYLKHMDSETALTVVRSWVLGQVPEARKSRMFLMHKDLTFAHGDEGGIKVVDKTNQEQSFYVSDDEKSIIVQDLLEDIKEPKLVVDFYLSLTADLTDMMTDELTAEPELPPLEPGVDVEKQLLEIEATMDTMMYKMRRNLMVIRLLGLYSEDKTLQDNLMNESPRMIKFIGATIHRAARSMQSSAEVDESSCVMASQSLNMSLTILSLHLTQADVSTDDWKRMQEYLEDLSIISDHPDGRIARIAKQLHQLVSAQGEVIHQTNRMRQKTKDIQEETKKLQAKADELKDAQRESENAKMDERKQQLKEKAETVAAAKAARKKKSGLKEEEPEMKILEDKEGMSPYEAALYDVKDPLLPVRGHGIIELTKLIDAKDEETLEHIGSVFQIFVDSLEDEDTYIYLSCINGLVSSARYRTEPVLDTLTKEFTQVYQRKNLDEDKTVEVRTKIGEALVRATKELGDVTPKYKNLLLNAFFSAASDPEDLVRASSLSNLGEVCQNIKFSLGPIAGELMMHLEASARDKAVEVRRAAAMVLTMVLQGLGMDSFTILEQYLRDIHRSLRLRLNTETDDVALVHVNLALDEIDKIVRELFSPNLTQEQTVFVTN